jgi:hypothetical protein
MRLSTSNILLGVTPTISIGSSSDDPANITDPDFSTSYAGTDNNNLVFDFGSTASINYVAIAGINIEGLKDYSSYVQVINVNTVVATNFVIRNNCVMLTFESTSFTNLRVRLNNPIGNLLPMARFIAAGNYLQAPNGGEQAGYIRQFLSRNKTTKSTLNSLAAPVSVLTKKQTANATLSLPNMTKEFSEGDWQTFLDFSNDNYFFISEEDTDLTADFTQNSSAYLCFEVTNAKTSANAQTRSLNDVSINFKVFNGL